MSITVKLRFFGGAADATGCRELVKEVPAGSTVSGVGEDLARQYPRLEPFLRNSMWAVNEEYAPKSKELKDGDEIVMIPPVSGGSANEDFQLTWEPLSVDSVVSRVAHRDAGAIVVFLGVVREHTGDRTTLALEYEAYETMAVRQMAELGREVAEKWPETRLAIAHRLGHLDIGEISVVIAASSPHRPDAFAACRHAIERLKQVVPIWKKEIWADGTTEWVGAVSGESGRAETDREGGRQAGDAAS